MAEEQHAPIWAKEDVFPPKPVSGASSLYGFVDIKGNQIPAENIAELIEKINASKNGVDLIWSPNKENLQAPEEVSELRKTIWKRRSRWAKGDIEDGRRMCILFGAVVLWTLYANYRNTGGEIDQVLLSPSVGISGILLLIFGLIPMYEGNKILKKGRPQDEAGWQVEADDSRFDGWLYRQKIPTTYFLMGVMVVAGLAQLYLESGFSWSSQSVERAGLLKHDAVEWWRFLTAPFLHGNLLHWVMNSAALLFLGRRVELLARWPHVIIVMVSSAWVGGMASSYLLDSPSVGVSGGIMGLLGFLLVFESLHKCLVPKSSRRRLVVGIVTTALMGVLGYQFIDNAAHAGGLITGMIYAFIGFPVSKSPRRPAILKQDRWIALTLGGVILGGLVLVLIKLFA